MNDYDLLVTPRHSAIPGDRASELDVLVRLQAPDRPADESPERAHTLNLACVIDRSGSMSGQPLEEAKRCVGHIIDGLEPRDRAAVVVYDNRARVLVPGTPVTEPAHLKSLLAGVHAGGATDLHGGWLRGAEQLVDAPQEDAVSRVILLSDGNANAGLTDPGTIAAQCEELATAGVTTSTYGLGRHFNEQLMIDMARHGGGNHYYGETAADLLEPFREEFDLLQDLCARHVRLRIMPSGGVRARVVNDYQPAGRDTWRLPDLAWASEGWALLRLEISEEAVAGAAAGDVPLLELEVELVDTAPRVRRFLPGSLTLPAVASGHAKLAVADELVAARAVELDSAGLQQRIRDAAAAGDWSAAERLLAQAERDAVRHPWLREMLGSLRHLLEARDQQRFLKESAYAAPRLNRRLAERGTADHAAFDAGCESRKRSYLRRRSRQGRRTDDSGERGGRE
ncbi:MAG: vWA domain-containing protein [Pseudomonadota bacterium]